MNEELENYTESIFIAHINSSIGHVKSSDFDVDYLTASFQSLIDMVEKICSTPIDIKEIEGRKKKFDPYIRGWKKKWPYLQTLGCFNGLAIKIDIFSSDIKLCKEYEYLKDYIPLLEERIKLAYEAIEKLKPYIFAAAKGECPELRQYTLQSVGIDLNAEYEKSLK